MAQFESDMDIGSQRKAICSLPDSRIRLLGKKSAYTSYQGNTEESGFLRSCRIRADRMIAAEQAEREIGESRLLARRQAAAEEKQEAERRLEALRASRTPQTPQTSQTSQTPQTPQTSQTPQTPQTQEAAPSLRVHKAEKRLEKQRKNAADILRSCQLETEQLRIRTSRRQDGWEAAYKEIESLYLQGRKEGRAAHENQ